MALSGQTVLLVSNCFLFQGLMLLYGLMMADVWLLELLDMSVPFVQDQFQVQKNNPGSLSFLMVYF